MASKWIIAALGLPLSVLTLLLVITNCTNKGKNYDKPTSGTLETPPAPALRVKAIGKANAIQLVAKGDERFLSAPPGTVLFENKSAGLLQTFGLAQADEPRQLELFLATEKEITDAENQASEFIPSKWVHSVAVGSDGSIPDVKVALTDQDMKQSRFLGISKEKRIPISNAVALSNQEGVSAAVVDLLLPAPARTDTFGSKAVVHCQPLSANIVQLSQVMLDIKGFESFSNQAFLLFGDNSYFKKLQLMVRSEGIWSNPQPLLNGVEGDPGGQIKISPDGNHVVIVASTANKVYAILCKRQPFQCESPQAIDEQPIEDMGDGSGAINDGTIPTSFGHLAVQNGVFYISYLRHLAQESGEIHYALVTRARIFRSESNGWKWQAPKEKTQLPEPVSILSLESNPNGDAVLLYVRPSTSLVSAMVLKNPFSLPPADSNPVDLEFPESTIEKLTQSGVPGGSRVFIQARKLEEAAWIHKISSTLFVNNQWKQPVVQISEGQSFVYTFDKTHFGSLGLFTTQTIRSPNYFRLHPDPQTLNFESPGYLLPGVHGNVSQIAATRVGDVTLTAVVSEFTGHLAHFNIENAKGNHFCFWLNISNVNKPMVAITPGDIISILAGPNGVYSYEISKSDLPKL